MHERLPSELSQTQCWWASGQVGRADGARWGERSVDGAEAVTTRPFVRGKGACSKLESVEPSTGFHVVSVLLGPVFFFF